MSINPWGTENIDVEKLFTEFGLQRMEGKAAQGLGGEFLLERGVLVAHRGFDQFIGACAKSKRPAAMSGIKPTGMFHLGSLRTAQELVMLQRVFGAKVFYSIADLEAYADNGLTYAESEKNAMLNVADLLALGLDEKNAHIYRQSREMRVIQLANIFAKHTTKATMEAVYGDRHMGLYLSAMVQMGDIYLPQHEDFGFGNVVVPVGLDQDPHIRLARDIAHKGHGLKLSPPSAIYHKTITSLEGSDKMSKRNPDSMLTLYESDASLKRKLANAFTGGRDSAEEQRELGGRADICPIYHLCSEMFDSSDRNVKERFGRCTKGELLCGGCKKEVHEIILQWMKEHREKRDEKEHIAKEIVRGRFY